MREFAKLRQDRPLFVLHRRNRTDRGRNPSNTAPREEQRRRTIPLETAHATPVEAANRVAQERVEIPLLLREVAGGELNPSAK